MVCRSLSMTLNPFFMVSLPGAVDCQTGSLPGALDRQSGGGADRARYRMRPTRRESRGPGPRWATMIALASSAREPIEAQRIVAHDLAAGLSGQRRQALLQLADNAEGGIDVRIIG